MNRFLHPTAWSFVKVVYLYVVIFVGIFGLTTTPLSTVFAQPTPTINYQGKLTTPTGIAVTNGTYAMEFKLYTQASGGSAIWTETRTGGNEVTVTNGLFSVMLGSVTSLSSVNFNQPLYLGVNIESDGEMTPRKVLGTVPAAFEAKQLGGVASTSFLRSDATDTASGLLTFTGGLISTASSSIARATFTTATTTTLAINNERFTDLTGTGLINNSGVLTIATSTLGLLSAGDINTSSELAAILTDETGTGALVFSTSPVLTTPNLGTPSAVTLTNATGLPIGGLTGLGSGVATWLATPSSANLRTAITDETGNGGGLVFASEPTFTDTGGVGGGTITLGTSGMTIATDGDGAISFFGLGNGTDENLTLNLDDTADTGVFTSSSGLTVLNFSSITLQESGSNVLSVLDLDTCAEFAALGAIETGTCGSIVLSVSPTFTGTVTGDAANFTGQVDLGSTSFVSSNGTLRIVSGTVSQPAFSFENDNNTGWYNPGDGAIRFSSNNSDVFSIISGGNVGIGTTTPNQRFTVEGNINLSSPTGGLYFDDVRYLYASSTNDSVVFGESAGSSFNSNTFWNVAIGHEAAQNASNSNVDGNVFLGYQAGRETTGSYGLYLGYRAGYQNTGNENYLLGANAGYQGSGSNNTIIGGGGAGYNSSASNSNFIGFAAGYSSGGSNNNFLGGGAGNNNTGSENNFIGTSAGRTNAGSYNNIFGYNAGYYLTSSGTVAIGREVLFGSHLTSFVSDNTIALGYRAGYASDDGSGNNILIGYRSADNLTTGNNNIIIGYDIDNVTATADNRLNIGNLLFGTGLDGTGTTLSSGNIGIGTSSPSVKLDVAGRIKALDTGNPSTPGYGFNNDATIGLTGFAGVLGLVAGNGNVAFVTSTGLSLVSAGSASTPVLRFGNDINTGIYGGSDALGIATGGTARFNINSTGDVGIGTTSPYAKLSITNSGSGPSLIVEDAASSDTTPFIIDAAGKIGIGTVNTTNNLLNVRNTTGNVYIASFTSQSDLDSDSTFISIGKGGFGYDGGSGEVRITDGGSAKPIIFRTTAGEGFRVTPSGTVNIGGDTTPNDFFTVGATSQFMLNSSGVISSSNNITPNSILSAGQTDEYCLTYEGTGTTFEWQTCGGGSLFTDGGATTYLTATGDFLGVGTTTANHRLTVEGNINLSAATGAIYFDDVRYIYASSTNDSVIFGENAGVTFTSQTVRNIAIGYEAGMYASTSPSDYNIFVGSWAGKSSVGYGNTGIGVSAGETNSGESNNFIGESAGIVNTGNFNNLMGYFAGEGNTGDYNNIIGVSAGSNNTNDYNNLFGLEAGFSNTGSHNNIFGKGAGYSNTGIYNNIIGVDAGASNTGEYNTLIGADAGLNNSGDENEFIGFRTGYSNNGNFNQFIGSQAGRYLQSTTTIAIGAQSLFGSHTTDYISLNNVALGYRAGYASENGSGNNILIGYQAADNLTTGNNNIIIGYDIDNVTATADNSLNIGNLIFGTGLDGTGTTHASGNIGISTTSPIAKLSIFATSTSATAGNLWGTYTSVSDTGAVTTGTDLVYGNRTAVTRTGTSGSADTMSYGQYVTVLSDTGAQSGVVGGYFSATGADQSTGLDITASVPSAGITGATGIYLTTTNSSTNSSSETYGIRNSVTNNGVVTSGSNNSYANYTSLTRTGATGGTLENYANYTDLFATFASGAGTINNYGDYIGVTGNSTGASTNYGVYATVSGADTNYSGIFMGGNFGIGDATPAALFTVGSGDLFQINSSGVIASSNNLTPNAILSTGQADEECLTYEATGSTFEWQSCGAGGGMSIGGSITSATEGSVLFAGPSGNLAQDNANFFWDDVGNYLGLGTISPQARLDILLESTDTTGDILLGNFTTVTDSGVVTTGSDETNGSIISVTRTGATGGTIVTYGQRIEVLGDTGGTSLNYGLYTNVGGADTNYAAVFTGGNVGIGDASPDAQLDIASSQTSGTLIGYANEASVTLAGALTGMNLNLATSYTATGQSVTGHSVSLPTVTNTAASTYTYRGLTVTGGAITQTTAAGTNTFTGAFITNSNLTQTTGTLTSNGVSVTTGTNTTGGTQQGFNVIGAGVGAGTLNGINIANITGAAGTENAINIGTGYDNILNTTPFDIAGTGATTIAPLTTFTTGTILSIGAGGATTLSAAYNGVNINLRSNFTATGQSINGLLASVPNVANTGAGTYNYNLLNLGTSGGTLSQATGAGTNNYRGAYIFTPNITQSAGTVTANGVVVETGTITTNGTQNGFSVVGQGVGAGTLNGLNFANITGGAGTENAINVGTGYDNILNTTPFDIAGTGATTIAPLTTFTTGNTISLAFGAARSLTGQYTGFNQDYTFNLTATNQSVTGNNVTLPAVTNTGSGAYNYRGLTVGAAGALVQTTAAGNSRFNGVSVTNPNITQTTGSVTASGLSVTTGTITTGGNQYGIEITGQAVSAGGGQLNAIRINNIGSGGAGLETALSVGDGYDYILQHTALLISDSGATAFTPKSTLASGSIISSVASSGTTLTDWLYGVNLDLETNYTATGENVTGYNVILPTVSNASGGSALIGLNVEGNSMTTTGSANNFLYGLNIQGGTITQGSSGFSFFQGLSVTNPNITQTSGSAIAAGISITTGTLTTGGIQGGISVLATGVGVGTLTGIEISSITGGAGTEQAIVTGTGWDYGIYSQSRMFVSGDNATAYVGEFFNDGNNANRYGLKVQAGADDASGTTYYLDAYDGDGGQVGYIANTAGTFALTDVSDIRTKVNITDTEIVNATDIITGLRVVDFNRRADVDGPRITGFIAQEVQEVYPYAVTVGKTGYLGVMKDAFVPLLVKGAQEQQTKITTLGDTLLETVRSVSDLEAMVAGSLGEYYSTEDESLEVGELVTLATTSDGLVARATAGTALFGVIAEDTGLVLGMRNDDAKPVALAGRARVKVNDAGGEIAVGDAITLSSEAGVGTKATTTGRVIGTALESFDDEEGTIFVFIEPRTHFAQNEDTSLASLFIPIENNPEDTLWNRITTLASNFVDGILSVTGVRTDELCVGDVCVNEAEFLQIVEQAGGNSAPAAVGGGDESPNPELPSDSEPEVTQTPEEPTEEPTPDPTPEPSASEPVE